MTAKARTEATSRCHLNSIGNLAPDAGLLYRKIHKYLDVHDADCVADRSGLDGRPDARIAKHVDHAAFMKLVKMEVEHSLWASENVHVKGKRPTKNTKPGQNTSKPNVASIEPKPQVTGPKRVFLNGAFQKKPGEAWDPNSFSVKNFLKKYITNQQAEPSNETLFPDTDAFPQQIANIIQVSAFVRTPEMKAVLFNFMRNAGVFTCLPDVILSKVIKELKLKYFEAGETVCLQGDDQTLLYALLVGTVSVNVEGSQNFACVETIPPDASIGPELKDQGFQMSTITAKSALIMATIEKQDHTRILKTHNQAYQAEKQNFLKKHPFFQSWTDMKPIAALFQWQDYGPGQVVVSEGAQMSGFMILRKGSCVETRQFKRKNGKVVELTVRTIGTNDYFCETGVLQKQPNAVSTIQAGPRGCQAAMISFEDARQSFLTELEHSHQNQPAVDLCGLYTRAIASKRWDRVKAESVDGYIKERSQDPNMTLERWNGAFEQQRPRHWQV